MNVQIIPADTTPEAARIQFDVFRSMQPPRRLELALQMSTTLRNVTAAGVRSRHPEYTEQQVKMALVRLTIGEKLFAEAYPGVDVQV